MVRRLKILFDPHPSFWKYVSHRSITSDLDTEPTNDKTSSLSPYPLIPKTFFHRLKRLKIGLVYLGLFCIIVLIVFKSYMLVYGFNCFGLMFFNCSLYLICLYFLCGILIGFCLLVRMYAYTKIFFNMQMKFFFILIIFVAPL